LKVDVGWRLPRRQRCKRGRSGIGYRTAGKFQAGGVTPHDREHIPDPKLVQEAKVAMRANNCRIVYALTLLALFLVPPAACAAQGSAVPGATSNSGSASLNSQNNGRYNLSSNALQVARIIGVESDIARLSELTTAKTGNTGPVTSLEELGLRQRITDAVVVASLDIDSALDELDYEQEQIVELTSLLRTRRDRALGTTNVAVLAAGTGLGIVGGVLSFSKKTSTVGNAIGFASGGIATLFSLRSYRQVHAEKRPPWVLPNMLAAFLSQTEEGHSHYPEHVWAYLNSVPPDKNLQASRRAQLLAEWIVVGRMGPLDSSQSKQKIAVLTSTNATNKMLSIELLGERGVMLADVRDEIAQMNHALADLLQGLSQQGSH
jgi:hypothetical protein